MNIGNITKHKGAFFKILDQTERSQVGVMTLGPGKDSGPEERHSGDQLVFIVSGEAAVEVDGSLHKMVEGDVGIIPAGAQHHIWNKSDNELFFLTVYTPPQY